MVKVQMTILVLALTLCSTVAEARGHRMARQQAYTQYYTPAAPTMTVAAPTNVVVQTTNYAQPSNTVYAQPSNAVIQTSAVETSGSAVMQANSVVSTPSVVTQGAPVISQVAPQAAAAPGSAQWKAEQSARIGSVQHLGGGFGGGSFEGNGFGATADQAIRNSCYWGQRTPIEIGVARGANGYYATIFYR
jgi:hypothetical protein